MNELIKIEQKNGIQTVNARELHDGLLVKDRLDQWISRRIEKYGFVEGQDFCTELCESTGGRPSTEYYFSIDMAKELCMVENNDEGRKYRQYFIACEKELRNPTGNRLIALAIIEAQKLLDQKDEQIKIMEPKAQFFDQVTSSKDAIEMKDVAKVLNIPKYGRNNLFLFLRERKILMNNNTPYQEYIDRGYFRVIESKWTTPEGEIKISLKTVVYQKGLNFITREINK